MRRGARRSARRWRRCHERDGENEDDTGTAAEGAALGRSDTSAAARWFWEIDKVLLILVAVLIAIGLIAVAAASPAAGQRLSGGGVDGARRFIISTSS